jgi:hypothetical protein
MDKHGLSSASRMPDSGLPISPLTGGRAPVREWQTRVTLKWGGHPGRRIYPANVSTLGHDVRTGKPTFARPLGPGVVERLDEKARRGFRDMFKRRGPVEDKDLIPVPDQNHVSEETLKRFEKTFEKLLDYLERGVKRRCATTLPRRVAGGAHRRSSTHKRESAR